MANRIKMEEVQTIRCLLKRKWSYRRIARELGLHRDTVSRYAKIFESEDIRGPNAAISTPGFLDGQISKPAISTPGTSDGEIPKPAISTPGSCDPPPGRRSLCEEYQSVIVAYLENGLQARRIFQDLRDEHGFEGSYSSVKRFVKKLNKRSQIPCRRFETEPGLEAQVDFGSGPTIPGPDGRMKKTWIFRIVLSNSRAGYSEAVHSQSTDSFIRCLENAWRFFGGVPTTLVLDNMKAAVKKCDWFDPEIHQKLDCFSKHYGFAIWPARVASPQYKGKIENGIKYIKNNCLKGRRFNSLEMLNEFLRNWELNVANKRIHGTTKKQVQFMLGLERPHLCKLPLERFPNFEEGRRKVHRDGHVEVARSFYSVPPEYTGREVLVRWDAHLVRVFNLDLVQICAHTKCLQGRFSTHQSHIDQKKISAIERGEDYLMECAKRIGLPTYMWAKATVKHRGITGLRAIQGVISLSKKYEAEKINKACKQARVALAFKSSFVRKLCERHENPSAHAWLEEHEVIRPLSQYKNLIQISTAGSKRSGNEPKS